MRGLSRIIPPPATCAGGINGQSCRCAEVEGWGGGGVEITAAMNDSFLGDSLIIIRT